MLDRFLVQAKEAVARISIVVLVLGCVASSLIADDDCRWAFPGVGFHPPEDYCPASTRCTRQGQSCRPGFVLFFIIPLWCTCPCPDAEIDFTLRSTEPIGSFPSAHTFVVASKFVVRGLGPGTLTATATGTMSVKFELNSSLVPPRVMGTVQAMAFRIRGLPTATAGQVNLAVPLPISTGSFPFERFIGFNGTPLPESSLLFIDPVSGTTSGVLGVLFSTPQQSFSFKGGTTGGIDFGSGVWSLHASGPQCPVNFRICDINSDGNVDRTDIDLIFTARGAQITALDARDADGDRIITVNDARICTLACSNPLCAP